jgi:hypothetical protein
MYMKLKCKCGHEWNYKGSAKHYVTCPSCYNKVRIGNTKEYFILDDEDVKALKLLQKNIPEYKGLDLTQIAHKELGKLLEKELKKRVKC